MESPHLRRHAVLLERITKNAVGLLLVCNKVLLKRLQDKCNEAMREVVKCLSVSPSYPLYCYFCGLCPRGPPNMFDLQEITTANESAVQTAQLFAAYRSFVSKNMEIKGINQPVKLEGSIHPPSASTTS